jgi:hypothetical protein
MYLCVKLKFKLTHEKNELIELLRIMAFLVNINFVKKKSLKMY